MHFLLRLLLWLYYPFLATLCLCMAAAIAWLTVWAFRLSVCSVVFIPAIVLLGATLWQVLRALPALVAGPMDDDPLELRPGRDRLRGLYDLVAKVARERRLSAPHTIYLGADTVAHVYEDDDGHEILVVGGEAIRGFSMEALGAVIAHELTHHAAGHTRLARHVQRAARVMDSVDKRFRRDWSHQLNPLVWLIGLYHLLYRLILAACSRQQVFAADRRSVEQAGAETTAAALVRVTLAHRLPYLRLTSIAESHLETGQPLELLFGEQERRSYSIYRSEWAEAFERELRRETEIFDSHPSLRDRLKAIGVSPKKALDKALESTGLPARELFDDWDSYERELTSRLVRVLRERQQAKQELAQVLLGRPPRLK